MSSIYRYVLLHIMWISTVPALLWRDDRTISNSWPWTLLSMKPTLISSSFTVYSSAINDILFLVAVSLMAPDIVGQDKPSLLKRFEDTLNANQGPKISCKIEWTCPHLRFAFPFQLIPGNRHHSLQYALSRNSHSYGKFSDGIGGACPATKTHPLWVG